MKNDIRKKEIKPILGIYDRSGIDKIISESLFYDKKVRGFGIPIYAWGKIYKKEIAKKGIKHALGIFYAEDNIITLECLNDSERIVILEDCLWNYRLSEQQVTRKFSKDKFKSVIVVYNRIQQIDKNHLTEKILPVYLIQYLLRFIYKIIRDNITFSEFKDYILFMTGHEEIKRNLRPYKIFPFRCNMTILLLQFRQYKLLYFIHKLKENIKNGISN